MTVRAPVVVNYTPHAYWPDQPHSMPRPITRLTVIGQAPSEAMAAILADLGKRVDAVGIAPAKTGGVAIITVDGTPVPLAYISEGMTRAEADEAMRILKRGEG